MTIRTLIASALVLACAPSQAGLPAPDAPRGAAADRSFDPRVRGSSAARADEARDLPACTAPLPRTDTPWREVRADGFTFCVPASWRPDGPAAGRTLDPRTWRSPTEQHHPSSASITWGTGVAPTRLQTRTAIADVRAGALPLPPHKATPWPADVRYTELLGGRTAQVSEWRFDGPVYQTQAQWRDPVVYLQGETRNEMMAQLLLAIHRSIRFTPASPP